MKTATKTQTTQPLIPMSFQVPAGKYLREQVGANEEEIKALQGAVEEHLKKINQRVETDRKYSGLPNLVLKRCCPHNSCNRAYINGIEICGDATNRIINLFPQAETAGVNAGRLWEALEASGYSYNWRSTAAQIAGTFTKKQQALVRKHFRATFKGFKFVAPVVPVAAPR